MKQAGGSELFTPPFGALGRASRQLRGLLLEGPGGREGFSACQQGRKEARSATPNTARLAQWKSTSFTRKGSQVQVLQRAPSPAKMSGFLSFYKNDIPPIHCRQFTTDQPQFRFEILL